MQKTRPDYHLISIFFILFLGTQFVNTNPHFYRNSAFSSSDFFPEKDFIDSNNAFIESISSTCFAPSDTSLNCTSINFYPGDLAEVRMYFGTVDQLIEAGRLTIADSNSNYSIKDTIEWIENTCVTGTLFRIFTLTFFDAPGNVEIECSQKIDILPAFDYVLKFPGDTNDSCLVSGTGGELVTNNFGCETMAFHRDTTFSMSSGEGCAVRTVNYRVINWCEYDGITLEPTIVERDIDGDGNFEEDTYVKIFNGDVWIDDDDSVLKSGPIPTEEEFIIHWGKDSTSYESPNNSDSSYVYTHGYFIYTQKVEIFDNTPPTLGFEEGLSFCIEEQDTVANCLASIKIPIKVVDLCVDRGEVREILISLNGMEKENLEGELYTLVDDLAEGYSIQTVPGKGLPIGQQQFTVTFADNCGNVATEDITFNVEDCSVALPLVDSIYTVLLTEYIVEDNEVIGAEASVKASDFATQGIIDCSPHPNPDTLEESNNNVIYYIVRLITLLANGVETPNEDFVQEQYRTINFNCDDLTIRQPNKLFLIAADGVGNFNYTEIMVFVYPGLEVDPCFDEPPNLQYDIAGIIQTEEGELLQGTKVHLSGQISNVITVGEGSDFRFSNLRGSFHYSIKPSFNENPGNGVSTFDLVQITKHILGIQALDSPYKLIASDVDNSGSLTIMDLIQIRKLILGLSSEFENTTSWVFVPKNHIFTNPLDPWIEHIPDSIRVDSLTQDILTADFIAIKKGDVNGSASTNSKN